MNCHNCQAPMTGRKRKFCTKNCGTKYAIANNKRRCEIDGCDKRHVAKGMCKTHYNNTLPERHRKVEKTCDTCGNTCMKYAQADRYAGTYCSLRCRDDAIRTVWPSSPLPDDHWGRWYGASTSLFIRECTSCSVRFTTRWSTKLRCHSECKRREELPRFTCGTCHDCGNLFAAEVHGSSISYCSTRCSRRVGRRKRRAREHNAIGDYRYSEIMRQYQRQGLVCAYCKQPANGLPDPEHVLALSRGGRNDISNLVAACRACNADKIDLTLEEWKLSRQRRGLPPVDTTLDAPEYRHLAMSEPTSSAYSIAA